MKLLYFSVRFIRNMIASSPIPSPAIAQYVQRILVLEDKQLPVPLQLPLYANGTPTLLFQSARGWIQGQRNHFTLFGQTLAPDTLRINEPYLLIAYFLNPLTVYPLFGISPSELTDRPLNLEYWRPSVLRTLQQRMLDATMVEENLSLLDEFILSLSQQAQLGDARVMQAVSLINTEPAEPILHRIQRELYITPRTFQRKFLQHIGISPSQYRRVAQFNNAFQQLAGKRFSSLADIAFENGYSDQSHYIRSFREFTGITPSEYLQL